MTFGVKIGLILEFLLFFSIEGCSNYCVGFAKWYVFELNIIKFILNGLFGSLESEESRGE